MIRIVTEREAKKKEREKAHAWRDYSLAVKL